MKYKAEKEAEAELVRRQRDADARAYEVIKEAEARKAEAEALRFEQAAALRDRINAISALSKKQTVIAGLCADTDIWGLCRGAGKCCYAVLHMEEGNLAGRETELFTAPMEEGQEEMLSALTAQYYLPRAILPHEILLPFETEGYCESLSEALTKRAGHKVWVHVPRRGEKADLRAMAQRNAAEEAERATTAQERVAHTLELLQKMLNLPAPPERMESFDISNTGKSDIVASMVVYSGTRPLKSAYRRFRIKDLEGKPDDYASMREIVYRRYSRLVAEGAELPDLIIADGGKGQMGAIHEVLEHLQLDIPIAGLAKDSRHRTAELLCGYPPLLVGLRPTSPLFHLLSHIQEEVHRFAISFHRQKRSKDFIHSELEQIPGVGEKTVRELLQHFRNVAKVKAASFEELAALVGEARARKIRSFFHPEV